MAYNDIPLSLPAFIALDWCLLIFSLIFIVVRIVLRSRVKVVKASFAANLSDAFIICSWCSAVVLVGINTWKNSLRHKYVNTDPALLYYSVPYDQSAHLLKVSFISLFWIYISLWFAKAAFLAFYWELFSLQSRRIRIAICAASAFAFCTFMVQMLLLGFWCNPVSGNWNTSGHLCSAVHDIKSVTVMTFTNIATDLILLGIPISTMALSRMGRMELSGLFFIFLMGSLSIVAALGRFVVLYIVEKYGGASITHTIDVLSLVEIVASIIAVCLPSFRLFLRKYRESLRNSISSGTRSCSSQGSIRESTEQKPTTGLQVTPPIDRSNSCYDHLLASPVSEKQVRP